MIKIIDYGLGNLSSIKNMISHFGYDSEITSNKKEINNSSKLILPGVGSFDTGVDNLKKLGLIPIIYNKVINEKCPILGICLGAQLMLEKSHEGKNKGLSFVRGEVISFNKVFQEKKINLPVPNMGWRDTEFNKSIKLKFKKTPPKFYFVHSYFLNVREKNAKWINSNYGIDFCAGFKYNNIMAVQFHPEKSHKYGEQVLKYFINNV